MKQYYWLESIAIVLSGLAGLGMWLIMSKEIGRMCAFETLLNRGVRYM